MAAIYIEVVATGTGSYTGTVTSAVAGPVTIVPVIQTFNTVGGPFTSTVPQGAINVDYLVVAGGGGGGRYGGGGGAGGVLDRHINRFIQFLFGNCWWRWSRGNSHNHPWCKRGQLGICNNYRNRWWRWR